MTTIALPADESLRAAFVGRVAMSLRVPSTVDAASMTFTPDLTAAEQATVALAFDQAKTETGLSADGYAAIRAQLQVLRDLRQLGRNAFMQLTAADRDRMIYDALVAVTQVFIIQARDA